MHHDLDAFVALIGPPNAGKTTLFNALTGSRFATANYPGHTVEYAFGESLGRYGRPLRLMDTPGTHSLFPKSLEEDVCIQALFGQDSLPVPDLVVAVVDATQLSRQLLLVDQLKTAGFTVVVAVTMNDLLQKRGKTLDAKALAAQLECPVVCLDPDSERTRSDLLHIIHSTLPTKKMPVQILERWDGEALETKMRQQVALQEEVVLPTFKPTTKPQASAEPRTEHRLERLDRWLLHPVWGLISFVGVMALLFTSIFWLAEPLMNLIDVGMSTLSVWLTAAMPATLWADFLANGVLTSMSAILVFVPQIAILFLGLSFLEASGYLARAASLIDWPLQKIGLNGRSFVPLLSGFACAIPAMMAARTIPSRKERWLTLFIIPLMSCSARLPVYALLLAFIFWGQPAWKAGLMMTVIYFGSLLIGAVITLVVRRFIRADHESFFMLELPAYRRPRLRAVIQTARIRTMTFIKNAGPIILVFSLLIWAGTTFPKYDLEDSHAKLSQSYAAQAGQYIEPVLAPMGVDWRVGVGLISAFAAREVFVPAMAVVFNVAATDDASIKDSLLESMAMARAPNGQRLFTTASIIGLIIFFMIALQCMSTVAIARREFGNWRDPIIQLVGFNVLAYGLAVGAVQGLRALGIA